MIRLIIFFLFCVFLTKQSNAQEVFNLKGAVLDKSNKSPIKNAIIYTLQSKDSILIFACRSDINGEFQISLSKSSNTSDSLVLLISYPNYAEYTDHILLDSTADRDLGKIEIISRSQLLEEVIVTGKLSAIKVKGDTTEYNADSFTLPENSTVEDLLKKLPGIQVSKNGQITAQGERVTQILVDGDEFFSFDPTLVTQNLNENIVSKVQVYDKKSEISKLLGVNDGNSTKAINLKLKENKKNGYFGKILMGLGNANYYDNKSFFSQFKGKRKFATYAIASNVGRSGLNSDEQDNFERPSLLDASDNIGQLDPWNGAYEQQGLPTILVGGVHYNNKWNEDKKSLSTDLKIQDLKIQGISKSISEFVLPDEKIYSKQEKRFANSNFHNYLVAKYDFSIDSMTKVKINFFGRTSKKESEYFHLNETLDGDGKKINYEARSLSTQGNLTSLNTSLSVVHKTKKLRRSILFNFAQNYNQENSSCYLISNQTFFANNNPYLSQVLDQYKQNKYNGLGLNYKLALNEPITEKAFLLISMGITNTKSNSDLISFNKSSNGKYDIIDSLFSSNFIFRTTLYKPEIGYTLIQNKYYIISSIGFGKTVLKQEDKFNSKAFYNSNNNLFPNFLISYKLASRRRLTFKYDGVLSNPSLQQVQETQINLDPLNTITGNANLKPSFANNYKITFFDGKSSTERELNLRLIYGNVINDISYNNTIDSFGKRNYQYVNLSGNRSITENVEYSYKFKKYDSYINVNAKFKQSRFVSSINNTRNIITNFSNDLLISLSKYKENKYDISLDLSLKSLQNRFQTQDINPVNFSSYSCKPNVDIYLPWKIKLHTDCDFLFYNKNHLFKDNMNFQLLNASIEKTVHKNNKLKMILSVNDILNKNIGISAFYDSNFSSQNVYNLVRRYGMFSLVWNFNKNNEPK